LIGAPSRKLEGLGVVLERVHGQLDSAGKNLGGGYIDNVKKVLLGFKSGRGAVEFLSAAINDFSADVKSRLDTRPESQKYNLILEVQKGRIEKIKSMIDNGEYKDAIHKLELVQATLSAEYKHYRSQFYF
jgi:hypothetical protein